MAQAWGLREWRGDRHYSLTIIFLYISLRQLHMYIFLLIVFLFLQRLAFSQPIGFVMPKGERKAEIPFELAGSLVVAAGRINGGPDLKFILDTRVRTCIILDKSITDLLAVKYLRKYNIMGAGGEKAAAAYVSDNLTVSIGSLESRSLNALVLEQDNLQLRSALGIRSEERRV